MAENKVVTYHRTKKDADRQERSLEEQKESCRKLAQELGLEEAEPRTEVVITLQR